MTRQICLVEGLWIGIKIPNFKVSRPNVFFSRAFKKLHFGRKFSKLKNELLKLTYINANMTAKLHFLSMSIHNGRSYGKL